MNLFKPALILGFAFIAVFGETVLGAPRHWLGAQVDVLPALMVYAALYADIVTISLLAVMGGVWLDSLSANPLGISIVPLMAAGFPMYLRRDLILRHSPFAQLMLGGVASAVVPALTVLFLLNGGRQPLIGWGSLWQWLVMTVAGALITPVIFALGDWCGGALGYKARQEVSFRPDREIQRGRQKNASR